MLQEGLIQTFLTTCLKQVRVTDKYVINCLELHIYSELMQQYTNDMEQKLKRFLKESFRKLKAASANTCHQSFVFDL